MLFLLGKHFEHCFVRLFMSYMRQINVLCLTTKTAAIDTLINNKTPDMKTGQIVNTKHKKAQQRKGNALVQLIGYVGMPSLDVLSAVRAAHKNGAALPYSASYHPTAHCKLQMLSSTGSRTITSDAVTADPLLSRVMRVWFFIFLFTHELSTRPAWLRTWYHVDAKLEYN